jgi:hypothetical protein
MDGVLRSKTWSVVLDIDDTCDVAHRRSNSRWRNAHYYEPRRKAKSKAGSGVDDQLV